MNGKLSLRSLIQRAKTDIKFQKALFDFLQNENDSLMQIGDKLDGSIVISKTLIKNNIDDLLNDEYEIDRTELIRTIQEDGEKYISIQGEAGQVSLLYVRKYWLMKN